MRGPKILPSGEVISSALNLGTNNNAHAEMEANFKLDIGQIVAIYEAEDVNAYPAGLQPSVCTLYDVIIRRKNGANEFIPRCRMLQPTSGGSINNFHEVLPPDPGQHAKDTLVSHDLKRGTSVLIGYLGGSKSNAVILGAMPHENAAATARRPKKSKGTYLEGEFQGLNYSVDNDGSLKITFNGPRKDDGALANQNGPTTVEIDSTGNINISNNNKQKVTISRTTGHIRVDAGATYIDMDQNGDKIDVVAKNVNVGTGGLQPQVVGDDWQKIMEELITEIMALYVPTGVGPSGTPVNTPKFAAIKAKLSDALSKKHKVEK